MKLRKVKVMYLKNPVAFVFLILLVSCIFVLFISVLRLPEAPSVTSFRSKEEKRKISTDERIGKFGEMVIQMLPEDLAFTVFLPSEKAFERDLRLDLNDSLIGEKGSDTYAVLTRILGFSAVPRLIYSDNVSYVKEIDFDSLAGFTLYISRDLDGMIVVNGIRSEKMDLQKGKLVLHTMDGVIMDAEFEQSVLP
ncbi:hypothetical protein M9H77_10889 [Catharanthus roseus]|uniref:Uncharacterized protein n=1 Tax=Catharanthus roseus TaxID=4058 RepID=A0ACC0BD20_CATRO|nr:hypothetical protein M9H77_10889 [Catharanthus roseus]